MGTDKTNNFRCDKYFKLLGRAAIYKINRKIVQMWMHGNTRYFSW